MQALTIEKLHKTYAGGTVALRDVSFTVEEGDFFALLGPNGAGKSTTIGIICGLVNKTSGRVQIFDADIKEHRHQARRYLGVVPQEFNFNIFEKVEQIVVNQAGYYGIPRKRALLRAEHCLKQLGLWEKRHEQAQRLSGGMKRRLMIARALIHQPRLLILDEPTAGVDIELRRSMWDFLMDLNRSGTTIILTTHYLEEAEQLCKNIAIIDQGRLVQKGPMHEFLTLLQVETLILDSAHELSAAPDLNGFSVRPIDSYSFEVDVHRGQSINQLLEALNQANVEIRSMRNRSNRLEELFLELTQSHSDERQP